MDTHDHLLTLIPEKSPLNLQTDSQASVEMTEPRNITRPNSSGRTTGRTITKAGQPQGLRRSEREDHPIPDFVWGQMWNFPRLRKPWIR
jgi:hypothetical protein